MDKLNISVCEGKYTVIQSKSGLLTALRHGEDWRDCCGDGLILALAQEIQYLRDTLKETNRKFDSNSQSKLDVDYIISTLRNCYDVSAGNQRIVRLDAANIIEKMLNYQKQLNSIFKG